MSRILSLKNKFSIIKNEIADKNLELAKLQDDINELESILEAQEALAIAKADILSRYPEPEPEVAAPRPLEPATKLYSVHDCHTHLSRSKAGAWAEAAISNGMYGVCIGPSRNSKENSNMTMRGPRGYVSVSKARWNHAKNIRVGDTLFLGDTHIGKVFKGVVTAQPVYGAFCPLGSTEESFFAKVRRPQTKPLTEADLAREVELVFKVDWQCVGELTEEWKGYLGTSRRVTVSELKSAPPS
jgi:hypothetical protein